MTKEPPPTALTSYLKQLNLMYYGKVYELREVLESWLHYIPQTFPYYTRHTIQHSDAIVLQISKLLFKDERPSGAVVELSAVESYILITAAYLHDSGMVASDEEKKQILSSAKWCRWLSSEKWRQDRWDAIQALRHNQSIPDDTIRNFVADLETRFLLAEFIRREHHIRAGKVIQNYQSILGRFAFDDPMLEEAIANVCVGHGLSTDELENPELYPELRDIRGEKVNLRFLAILLRLGDLLDMSSDRACPLLLNAASPIPSDSCAHWTQYHQIKHMAVTPERIEITAKCQNQDEHRVLQDWCTWIAKEVEWSATLMAHAQRHRDWKPPRVKLGDDVDATIRITPAPEANYIFRKWTFELDIDAIFERLIYDLYDLPETFVRELIQNALDASRSQLYLDLQKKAIEPPEAPTQVEEAIRVGYPVKVSLSIKNVISPLSQEPEQRQVIIVEDCGIGMNLDVIHRYFLQVGRSFYTTDEFRRNFRFVPTSRFGLGFLSVFAVSDQVIVETYKPSSENNDGPLRLTLNGPKNYLLIEKGQRKTNGTRIEVLLRKPMPPRMLTSRISMWCRRVEFPILVNELGESTIIRSERAKDFTCEEPDVTTEGAKFIIKAFPINRIGIEGEIYVLGYEDERGESWAESHYAFYDYPNKHPMAHPIRVPNNSVCSHGISLMGDASGPDQMSARVDYRGKPLGLTLSRASLQQQPDTNQLPDIISRREELLKEHIETSSIALSEEGWKYKNKLADAIQIRADQPMGALSSFWKVLPATIPIYINRQRTLLSVKATESVPTFNALFHRHQLMQHLFHEQAKQAKESLIPLALSSEIPVILDADFDFVSTKFCLAIFQSRHISKVQWVDGTSLSLEWSPGLKHGLPIGIPSYPYHLVEMPDSPAIGFSLSGTKVGSNPHSPNYLILLNANHPFVQWFQSVLYAAQSGIVSESQRDRLFRLLSAGFGRITLIQEFPDLVRFVAEWRKIEGLPAYLYPPDIELTPDLFTIKPPQQS
jgi:molecular chaperone HtpG